MVWSGDGCVVSVAAAALARWRLSDTNDYEISTNDYKLSHYSL